MASPPPCPGTEKCLVGKVPTHRLGLGLGSVHAKAWPATPCALSPEHPQEVTVFFKGKARYRSEPSTTSGVYQFSLQDSRPQAAFGVSPFFLASQAIVLTYESTCRSDTHVHCKLITMGFVNTSSPHTITFCFTMRTFETDPPFQVNNRVLIICSTLDPQNLIIQ